MFDQAYYTGNNYASYLERYERYERMVHELHYDLFRRMGLDFTKSNVLDYGCAVGFVTRALQTCGHQNVVGFDISEWAVEYGTTVMKTNNLSTADSVWAEREFALTFALDVLEHMSEEQLGRLFSQLRTDYLVVRVPVCSEDGGRFVLNVSENDPTHVQRLTKGSWNTLFEQNHFVFVSKIVLGHIYDTPGVMCRLYRYNGAKTL